MQVIERLSSMYVYDKALRVSGNVAFNSNLVLDITASLTEYNSYPRVIGHVGTYSSVFNSAFEAANSNILSTYPGATQLAITNKAHKNLYHYDFSTGQITVTDLDTSDQFTVAGTFNTYSATTTLNLLGGGNQEAKWRGYFYSAQVRENGVLTHDIYPALVDDNGTYKKGIYDAVTDNLLYTESTGTNIIYVKMDGTTLYYSDVEEDSTWDIALDTLSSFSTATQVLPYRDNLAIELASFANFCSGLALAETIDLSGFTTPATGTVSLNNLCYNCTALTDFTYPQMLGATSSGAPFNRAGVVGATLVLHGDFTAMTSCPYIFAGINANAIATGSGHYGTYYSGIDAHDTVFDQVVSITHIMAGWQNVTIIELPAMENVTYFEYAFVDCTNAIAINMSKIITATGTVRFNSLFRRCRSMVYWYLPRAMWSNIYAYSNDTGTFEQAGGQSITLHVIGSLANTDDLSNLFSGNGTSSGNSNDYGEIDLSKVSFGTIRYINNMFRKCPNLRTIFSKANIFQQGTTTGVYATFSGCSTNLVGQNGTVWSGTSGSFAVIDAEDTPGYLTYKASTDYTNVIFQPEGSGTASVTPSGTDDVITITPAEDYIMGEALLYRPDGRLYARYTTSTITVRRDLPGVWTLYVNCLKVNVSPYVPGTPLPDLPSDVIISDYPVDYLNKYANLGFYKIFIPTDAQLTSFISYLYSNTFAQALMNLWNRMVPFDDLITSVMIMPVSPRVDGNKAPQVGWVSLAVGTEMNYTNDQYMEVDLGTLAIPRVWDNHLDYSPHTSVALYLPFIGERALETDDVIGKTLNIKYRIDLLSGNCTASVLIGGSVHYQFVGQCAYTIPISSNDLQNVSLTALKSLSAVGGFGVATAGLLTGNEGLMSAGLSIETMGRKKYGDTFTRKGLFGANEVASETQTINARRVDSMSSNAGFMGINFPYAIISRTVPDVPANYGDIVGYPCNKDLELGTLHGFTQVVGIHLEDIPATSDELGEIEQMLKEGVLL